MSKLAVGVLHLTCCRRGGEDNREQAGEQLHIANAALDLSVDLAKVSFENKILRLRRWQWMKMVEDAMVGDADGKGLFICNGLNSSHENTQVGQGIE